jgi:hypothetical protein
MTTQWKETSSIINNKSFNYLFVSSKNGMESVFTKKLNSNLILTTTISCETIHANTVSMDTRIINDDINVNNVIVADLQINNSLKSDLITTDTINNSNTYNGADLSANNIVCDVFVNTGSFTYQDISINSVEAETLYATSDIFTKNISTLLTSLNNEFTRNNIQDITIHNLDASCVNIKEIDDAHDVSINLLNISINAVTNKNIIQDSSINKIDSSLNEQFLIDNNQNAIINGFLNGLNDISYETITLPSQTVINPGISTTYIDGSINTNITLTLADGTTDNFIKTIDLTRIVNIQYIIQKCILNSNLIENNVNIHSRQLNTRLKLRWDSTISRWLVLGDNYFIENGDTSIYTMRNVGIYTSSPQYNLDVAGTVRCQSLTQTSDTRLKENIIPINNALDKVSKLSGVSFNFTNQCSSKNNKDFGFIAQEVEPIFPELISNNVDFKSIKYQNITALLVEAIKELNEINIQIQIKKNLLR